MRLGIEREIAKYAIYSDEPEAVRVAPTKEIFQKFELQYLSEGLQARVFKVKNSNWVVKEARWDFSINLFNKLDIKLPFEESEEFLKNFGFCFLPKIEEVLRQYSDYLIFFKYFGFFPPPIYSNHETSKIRAFQRELRKGLVNTIAEVEQHYKFSIDKNIKAILSSKYKYSNFLVKEYLIYGESITPENEARNTSFIIQKFVRGNTLHDVDTRDKEWECRKEMIVMIYLILLMNIRENLLPDTRPRNPMIEANDWLLKTDNIIQTAKGLKFIDTRWFWDERTNMIKRGLILPEIIINVCKNSVNMLLMDIDAK